ncbi:competence/damage-inducible protein A [Gracilimonas mengyeensis]|uniref:CinA-like protein n=1 Tax=Gracilimonas mengyeensis TaxID=1302730 RepID=A0A521D7E4_9BACT|nr:competence/damage-inducible protein A [Gracilimonas mengyeensis]SMO67552.1 competence/damage-inducible protein cinA [Gracilimonas mengyeensis]
MKAHIISIGNELLIGDTINTNAAWLGEFLTGMGFDVKLVQTISDEADLIKESITQSMEKADLVISTGGLGPTHDDITKKAVAELFDVGFLRDEQTLEYIRSIFKKRNIPFSKSNYAQAEVPKNAEVLFNKAGTAPGMLFKENGSVLVVLPGVPHEMKYLMKKRAAPKLREIFGDLQFVYFHYIKTAGIGESTLSDEVLGDLSEYFTNGVSLAFLPSGGGVNLRLTATGKTKEEAKGNLNDLSELIYTKAKKYIYGEGKDYSISEAVGDLLYEQGKYISVAESCTGGLVANTFTDVPGSSRYFQGGIIAYDNAVKHQQLGVAEDDLLQFGAVSKPVALQMAKGVAERLGTSIGISTTGIAGPDGGTDEKPVGTVWMGFYQQDGAHFAVKTVFTKDRLMNKQRTMMVLMEITRRVLKGIPEMPYDLEKQYP